MKPAEWSGLALLKQYALVVARKMAFIAIGWVVVYFVSHPFRAEPQSGLNVLILFAPMIGALAGLVAGWYMATDAVEDSNLQGPPLWIIIVPASVAPMWIMEGVLRLFTRWPMTFGGFMLLTAATLLALAAAVWHASSQE